MIVTVDGSDIKSKVKELLMIQYGFLDDGAEDIAHDIEVILEESSQ